MTKKSTTKPFIYDDDCTGCFATYATLCIYPGNLDPQIVTERLGITPTKFQRKGEILHPLSNRKVKINGWFILSEDAVKSKDVCRHIDWIVDQILPQKDVIIALQKEGCRMCISCYWVLSEDCNRCGPTLFPFQVKKLADLNMEIWFDVYQRSSL